MGEWSYVVMAYLVVWGTIICYAVVLQRRITRSRAGVKHLRRTIDADDPRMKQEEPVCDPVSAP